MRKRHHSCPVTVICSDLETLHVHSCRTVIVSVSDCILYIGSGNQSDCDCPPCQVGDPNDQPELRFYDLQSTM